MSIHIGRDKILILAFFISVIFLGSVLLVIPGVFSTGKLQYVDALFTSTSAVCVTGLITVDTAQYSRLGQIIIMLLIQTGGLGIITFATLFLALPRQRISIISKGVISDYALSEVEYQPKVIIRSIVKYTLCFEAIGAAAYAVRFRALGYPLFYAVFHAVSAFCNAGFSTFSDNLESFVADPTVNFTTMFLIIIGGIGFIVIRDLRKFLTGERTHLSYHSKIVFKTTAVLIFGGAAIFFLLERNAAMGGLSFPQKIMASLFQSVTPRTAGFDTIAQNRFSHGSELLTMILMFIGASPASTGGGIKTTTFFILVMTAFRYKDTSDLVNHGGRSLMPRTVYKAVGVVVKGILIVLAASILIILTEKWAGHPVSLTDVVFETISAFGTVGLSNGITSSLHGFSKVILIITMFIGRVGLFALALPKTNRDVEGYARLPIADIMI
ncbi:MAG TPA: TrkH family potassium uptake protein [Rectinemataceae bacterium]|nr:TrkH family potassium uptake protein [Rectinemataceae bacterium]